METVIRMHNSIKQQINVIAESWAYFGPDPQFKGQSVRHNCGSCGAEITFSSMNIAVVKDETCDKCEQLVTY